MKYDINNNLRRAVLWLLALAITGAGPVVCGAAFGERAAWIVLGILLTSTLAGVILANGVLRACGAEDVGAEDAAAQLVLSGFLGGVALVVLTACAGGCSW